jgi:serine/threonine-protein kinase
MRRNVIEKENNYYFTYVNIGTFFGGIIYSYKLPQHKLERQLKLGNKYLEEEKNEEAILAFTKAIEIEPKTIDGRVGLATAYMETKQLANADKVNLLNELKVSEENYNIALKLMDNKKYIDAIDSFNKVMPDDVDIYVDSQNKVKECLSLYISENLEKVKNETLNNNYKGAINYLDLILKYDPKNSEAQKLKTEYNERINQQVSYKKYYNARFGFSIEYPSTFITKDLPQNNDGIILGTSDDRVELIVSGIYNVLDETPKSIYNDLVEEHSNASYKVQEDNWMVVSWNEGDNIIYMKEVVGSNEINTFIIEYPLSEKDYYSTIISHLVSWYS